MTTGPQPSAPAAPHGALANAAPDLDLRGFYRQEFERIRRDFYATGSGLASLSSRTRLVDRMILTLWERHFPLQPGCGQALIQ